MSYSNSDRTVPVLRNTRYSDTIKSQVNQAFRETIPMPVSNADWHLSILKAREMILRGLQVNLALQVTVKDRLKAPSLSTASCLPKAESLPKVSKVSYKGLQCPKVVETCSKKPSLFVAPKQNTKPPAYTPAAAAAAFSSPPPTGPATPAKAPNLIQLCMSEILVFTQTNQPKEGCSPLAGQSDIPVRPQEKKRKLPDTERKAESPTDSNLGRASSSKTNTNAKLLFQRSIERLRTTGYSSASPPNKNPLVDLSETQTEADQIALVSRRNHFQALQRLWSHKVESTSPDHFFTRPLDKAVITDKHRERVAAWNDKIKRSLNKRDFNEQRNIMLLKTQAANELQFVESKNQVTVGIRKSLNRAANSLEDERNEYRPSPCVWDNLRNLVDLKGRKVALFPRKDVSRMREIYKRLSREAMRRKFMHSQFFK